MRAGLSSLQELFPGPQARLHGPSRPGSARYASTAPVPRPARPCPDSDPLSPWPRPAETSRSRPGHDRSVTGAPHQGPRKLRFLRALYPVGHRSRHPPGPPPRTPMLTRTNPSARATPADTGAGDRLSPSTLHPGPSPGPPVVAHSVHADKHGPTAQPGPPKPTSSSRAALRGSG
jgi:hypothetical protein